MADIFAFYQSLGTCLFIKENNGIKHKLSETAGAEIFNSVFQISSSPVKYQFNISIIYQYIIYQYYFLWKYIF